MQPSFSDPKVRDHFDRILGAGEDVIWFQEKHPISPKWRNFAAASLIISIFWTLLIGASLLLGMKFGRPISYPWWMQVWQVFIYSVAILGPLLVSIEFIRTSNSGVHVLTPRRLILTNSRWLTRSLKTFAMDTLKVARRKNSDKADILSTQETTIFLWPVKHRPKEPVIYDIKNPEQFANLLEKHGAGATSNSGALK